jgi:hypothetical protein
VENSVELIVYMVCVLYIVIVGREVTRPAPRAAVTAADESQQIRILSLLDIYAVRSKERERDENKMQLRHEKNRHPSKQGAKNFL